MSSSGTTGTWELHDSGNPAAAVAAGEGVSASGSASGRGLPATWRPYPP